MPETGLGPLGNRQTGVGTLGLCKGATILTKANDSDVESLNSGNGYARVSFSKGSLNNSRSINGQKMLSNSDRRMYRDVRQAQADSYTGFETNASVNPTTYMYEENLRKQVGGNKPLPQQKRHTLRSQRLSTHDRITRLRKINGWPPKMADSTDPDDFRKSSVSPTQSATMGNRSTVNTRASNVTNNIDNAHSRV